MNTLEAIFSRRSIRKYTGGSLPDDLIMQILKAGMHAPSARNTRSWHFFVDRDRSRMTRLAGIHPYGKMLKDAGAAILVCGDLNREGSFEYQLQNCSAATQNMLLAAHELGLGAVWLGIQPRKTRVDSMIKFFNLPPHLLPVTLIAVGVPAEKPHAQERFNPGQITYL